MNIFIGSSRESLQKAETVARMLEELHHTPHLWSDPGVFIPGTMTFESLEKVSKRVDAAVFVFNEDDSIWYRNDIAKSVRDNVLIEYGLFCGWLSRRSVIIYYVGDTRIPSDLSGITFVDGNRERFAKEALKVWLANMEIE